MAQSLPEELERGIEQVADRLARAQRALFITGAGLSADSGLPTYRGVGGIYDDGLTEDGVPFEVALSGEMFRTRPEVTWRHLMRVEAASRGARPNRGHEVLAQLEHTLPHACVLTQNVDGFHAAAGSANLIEIHGNLHDLVCTACARPETVDDYSGLGLPPECSHCAGLMRPDVVLFGEMLPFKALDQLAEEAGRGFDIVVSIGTTSIFPYIAEPVLMANRCGAATAEINPAATEVSELVDVRLTERAAPVLSAIWERFQARHGHG